MAMSLLDGALPVCWHAEQQCAWWIDAVGLDWSRSFFADTVRCRSPLFATSRADLADCSGHLPKLLILSMGRAGSTLFTRLIDRPTRFACLREPTPLNDLLRSGDGCDRELLAGCVRALSHAFSGMDYALKLSSWNLLYVDAILAALPNVPILLLRRDPVEINASFAREPPSWVSEAGLGLGEIVSAIATAAQWIAPCATWVIEHEAVSSQTPQIAAALGLQPLPAAMHEAICSRHARHTDLPFCRIGPEPHRP
jgi:hypothetical protein